MTSAPPALDDVAVLLLTGAPTPEVEGTEASTDAVASALASLGADLSTADVMDSDQRPWPSPPDLVFNTIHGAYGEDGSLGAFLETLGVKHTGPPARVQAVCYNKIAFKQFASALGVRTPPHIDRAGGQAVYKPLYGGGSQGVEFPATRPAPTNGLGFLEQFVEGRFLTCAVFPDMAETLPVLAIDHAGPVFTYAAKRTPGARTEECPAELGDKTELAVRAASTTVYERLGARGPLRFDFIAAPDGLWLLEANTIPGLSRQGNLATICAAAGFTYEEMVEMICLSALRR